MSIFSNLNNLEDISLDPRYGAICGYTHEELEGNFSTQLQGCNLADVKRWYNGYCFLGESVYNPFDILLFLAKDKVFANYWFTSGTPSFLIDLIKARQFFIPNFESIGYDEWKLNIQKS